MKTRKLKFLVPLLSLSLFLIIFLSLYFHLELNQFSITTPTGLKTYPAAIAWGASVLVLTIALIVSMVNSLVSIKKLANLFETKVARSSIYLIAFLILIFVGFIVSEFSFTGAGGNHLHSIIASVDGCQLEISRLIKFLNSLAVCAVFLIAADASTIAYLAQENKEKIESSIIRAKRGLLASSAFLVLVIIEIYLQFSLAAACSGSNEYQMVSNSIALSSGIVYTALLLLLYVPLFSILGIWTVNDVATKNSHESLRNDPLPRERKALVVSAFILPILTGVIVNMISS